MYVYEDGVATTKYLDNTTYEYKLASLAPDKEVLVHSISLIADADFISATKTETEDSIILKIVNKTYVPLDSDHMEEPADCTTTLVFDKALNARSFETLVEIEGSELKFYEHTEKYSGEIVEPEWFDIEDFKNIELDDNY